MEGLTVYGPSGRLEVREWSGPSKVNLGKPYFSEGVLSKAALPLPVMIYLQPVIAGPIARPIASADCEVIAS